MKVVPVYKRPASFSKNVCTSIFMILIFSLSDSQQVRVGHIRSYTIFQ